MVEKAEIHQTATENVTFRAVVLGLLYLTCTILINYVYACAYSTH